MTLPEDDEALPRTRTDELAAYVLARVCTDTRPAAMRDALASIDPLDRGRVRKRVQAAIDDASSSTGGMAIEHVRRVALLDVSGVYLPLEAMRDVARVAAKVEPELARARVKPSYRTSLLTFGSIVLLVAAPFAQIPMAQESNLYSFPPG